MIILNESQNVNYVKTKIGLIPKNWEVKTLGDICIKIQDGNYGADYPKQDEFIKYGVPFLTSKVLGKEGNIDYSLIDYISVEKHTQLKKAHLKLYDVLFTNRGASVGAIGLVEEEIANGNIGPQLTLLRSKTEIVDNFFLYQVMKSKIVQSQIKKQDSGSAMKFFGISETKKFLIPIPNLQEQQKISNILSTWDKAIELKEKLIEQKKEQKTGLIETLLSGKKRIKGFNGEWKQVKLKEISHINKESLSNNTSSDYEFYYYDISSVENGNVAIQKDLIKFLDAPSRARRVFHENDILMSTVRPNLKGFAFIDFEVNDAICSTGFAVITAEEVVTNKLIYYNLFSKGIETQIEKLIVGSNYPAINAFEVGNLKIYYPLDHNERQQIVDIIYCADKELKLLQLELKFLKEQKQALMQQLLTGKVRVKA